MAKARKEDQKSRAELERIFREHNVGSPVVGRGGMIVAQGHTDAAKQCQCEDCSAFRAPFAEDVL